MDAKKLEIIQQLMEELTENMDYSSEDFKGRKERLFGKKPEEGMAIMKVEGMPGDEEEGMDEEDCDMPMGKKGMSEMMSMDEEDSPEDKFKNRLMKLRR